MYDHTLHKSRWVALLCNCYCSSIIIIIIIIIFIFIPRPYPKTSFTGAYYMEKKTELEKIKVGV